MEVEPSASADRQLRLPSRDGDAVGDYAEHRGDEGRGLRVHALVRRWRARATRPICHPDSADTFAVIDGTLDVCIDGEWRSVRAGETATIPAGVPHSFRNTSDETAKVKVTMQPAGRSEAFFRDMHGLHTRGQDQAPAAEGSAFRDLRGDADRRLPGPHPLGQAAEWRLQGAGGRGESAALQALEAARRAALVKVAVHHGAGHVAVVEAEDLDGCALDRSAAACVKQPRKQTAVG